MKTLGTKVNDNTYQEFQELSEKSGVTVSGNLRNLVEVLLTNKSDHRIEQNKVVENLRVRQEGSNINHILSCPDCQIRLADQGYILISNETWNKIRKYV